jgi:putative glutathione S-transferase
MIRYDYPHLSRWLRRLYWDKGPETNGGVFGKTTFFTYYKEGYLNAKRGKDGLKGTGVVPRGPEPDIWPLGWEVSITREGEGKVDGTNGNA